MCESNCSRPIVRQHFSFPQDISRMAIFFELHLHISSACFQRRCLGPFGEISGVRDVDFALNCGCVFLSFLKFGRVDYFRISSTQRARSMPTLFQLCLMPVFFGHHSSHCSASASPTLTWQSHSEDLPRSMSGECFGGACASCAAGCIFSNVVQVLVFAVHSFTSSDQAIHFQGFSHQLARTS